MRRALSLDSTRPCNEGHRHSRGCKSELMNANFWGAHGVFCCCCNWEILGLAGNRRSRQTGTRTCWKFCVQGLGGERRRKTSSEKGTSRVACRETRRLRASRRRQLPVEGSLAGWQYSNYKVEDAGLFVRTLGVVPSLLLSVAVTRES